MIANIWILPAILSDKGSLWSKLIACFALNLGSSSELLWEKVIPSQFVNMPT